MNGGEPAHTRSSSRRTADGDETDLPPKTDTLTLATSVIAGYGIGLTGFAVMTDVVTP